MIPHFVVDTYTILQYFSFRIHDILEPKGLNLVDLITNVNSGIDTNIMHTFVGITAVQIGLTDILTALGITPDLIIGKNPKFRTIL